MFNSKVFVAELIGTFALVFIGAGAGMAGAGLLGVALAHGLTLAVFAYAYGHISGTHVNPAVTFGLAANGNVKWGDAVVSYWIPQFGGAATAGYLLYTIANFSGANVLEGATVGSLTNSAPILAMIVEAVLTFLLVNTVLHAAVLGKAGPFAGWAIGTTLAVSILVGGPLTGASLNPARTFGTMLFAAPSFTNTFTYAIYFVGPLIGSTLAVIAFNFFSGSLSASVESESGKPAPVKRSAPRKVAKK